MATTCRSSTRKSVSSSVANRMVSGRKAATWAISPSAISRCATWCRRPSATTVGVGAGRAAAGTGVFGSWPFAGAATAAGVTTPARTSAAPAQSIRLSRVIAYPRSRLALAAARLPPIKP